MYSMLPLHMATRMTMNVSVTPQLERFVQALVASGRYHSASEVFRDALRLLQRGEHERLLETWLCQGLSSEEQRLVPSEVLERAQKVVRAEIQEGLDAVRRGDVIDGNTVFEEIRARGKRRRLPGGV